MKFSNLSGEVIPKTYALRDSDYTAEAWDGMAVCFGTVQLLSQLEWLTSCLRPSEFHF